MPIGTSDGNFFESGLDHQISFMQSVQQPAQEPDPQEAFNVAAQRIAKSVVHEDKPERDIPIANSVARLGGGLLELAKFPGRVYKGEVDIQSEEGKKQAADWAASMALNMVFTPAPLAAKAVDGTLGSIGGVKAKLSNDLTDNFGLAVKMERKDFHPDQIWDATGWYKGLDDKWRFEIPSKEAKLKVPPADVKIHRLDDVFDFPSLYEAYPQLRSVTFKMNPELPYLGAYTPGTNTIELNVKMHRDLNQNPVTTLLHEAQHKIQEIEKFPNGTNPTAAYQQFMRDMFETADRQGLESIKEALTLKERADKVRKILGERLYWNNLGEKEARMVEQRHITPDSVNRKKSPAKLQEEQDLRTEQLIQELKSRDTSNNPSGWETAGSLAKDDLAGGMGMAGAVISTNNATK